MPFANNKKFIVVSINLNNELKYEWNFSLPRIKIQITRFINYIIKEIFEEIDRLNVNNFKIIKDDNKYKLWIEFEILRKLNELYIEYNKLNKDDILKEIIKNKNNEINIIKDELNQYKNINK